MLFLFSLPCSQLILSTHTHRFLESSAYQSSELHQPTVQPEYFDRFPRKAERMHRARHSEASYTKQFLILQDLINSCCSCFIAFNLITLTPYMIEYDVKNSNSDRGNPLPKSSACFYCNILQGN